MPRESAAAKGLRLLQEGRLRVTAISRDSIDAVCTGDSAEVYALGWRRGRWYCSCPALGRCSHLVALQRVVLVPASNPARRRDTEEVRA
jgi:hypothetical protein